MLTKDRKLTISPMRKKGGRGASFFELAKRHIIKSKDLRNRTLSQDIDRILYGAN